MRTIAAINQKGGAGKTTTAVNLAACLGEKRRRVLVIDLDPQANASMWLGVRDGGRALLEFFTGETELADEILESASEGVSIIPSALSLSGVEKALQGEVGAELLLRQGLTGLTDFDYIIMDCPPSLGLLTVNALAAAGEVLIPVEAHVLALNGLSALVKTIEVVRERLNDKLEMAGILACRVDMRTNLSKEVVERLRNTFPETTYKSVIHENVRLAEAPSFAKSIIEYAPSSVGAADYRAFAREVIRQEQGRRA